MSIRQRPCTSTRFESICWRCASVQSLRYSVSASYPVLLLPKRDSSPGHKTRRWTPLLSASIKPRLWASHDFAHLSKNTGSVGDRRNFGIHTTQSHDVKSSAGQLFGEDLISESSLDHSRRTCGCRIAVCAANLSYRPTSHGRLQTTEKLISSSSQHHSKSHSRVLAPSQNAAIPSHDAPNLWRSLPMELNETVIRKRGSLPKFQGEASQHRNLCRKLSLSNPYGSTRRWLHTAGTAGKLGFELIIWRPL